LGKHIAFGSFAMCSSPGQSPPDRGFFQPNL